VEASLLLTPTLAGSLSSCAHRRITTFPGGPCLFATTGPLSAVFARPVGIPDPVAPDGMRAEERLSVTLKVSADEKIHQLNLSITDKTSFPTV
jgi:hypothetical protein